MSDKKERLTAKQQRFVRNYASGEVTATQAVLNAGYAPTTKHSANSMATDLMAKPKIQNALATAIEKDFPNLPERAAEVLYTILTDAETRPETKIKAIETLAKIFGWHAPTKHAQLSVSMKDSLTLPEE